MTTLSMFPVVLLAGGLATRLRPITETIPKSMVEINGYPFIYHQLKQLENQGITHVVICAGFLGEQIQDYVTQHQDQFELKIEFVFDGETLLGTGGAIKRALSLLPANFFVMYGDSFLTCNFADIQQRFIQSQQLALMTVYENHNNWDKSNVIFKDGQILTYDKTMKSAAMHYIDYGLGMFQKSAFDIVPASTVYDLATLYQHILADKQLAGYEVKERFYEIGSFKGIEETENFIKQQECV